MFFSIKELQVRKVPFEADLLPGEIDSFASQLRQISTLHAEGVAELLSNTLGEIRIHGTLSVKMEAECDRCLEPARFPVEPKFDLYYRPIEAELPAERGIDEGESEMGFYEDGGIDLRDVLREHIMLSLPMQQLCSEECRGICPLCGQNRNAVSCTCEQKRELENDRWSALRDFKSSLRVS